MRTLEMILRTEDRNQKRYRFKLSLDIWVQATLYVFIMASAILGEGWLMFYGHYFVLGFYQALSSQLHPKGKFMHSQRVNYNRYLLFHLIVIVPSAILVVPMFIILASTAVQAGFYFYVTIKEYSLLK